MKILLIFPPQWAPFSPPLSLPVLTAYLRKNGFDVLQKDANIEFYNYILTKDFIQKVKSQVSTFMDRCNNLIGTANNIDILPIQSQIRYSVINNLFKDLGPWWPDLETNTERAMAILKNPEMFYQPLFLAEAIFHLKYSLQACGLAYFPSDILLNYYYNKNYKLTFESILQAADDKEGNIFLEFYNQKLLKEITQINPDFVGISINCNTQLVGGLTLAKKIKEILPYTHINIGGNSFTRVLDVVEKHPEIFDNLVDSIICGEGERAIVDLVKTIEDKKDFSTVPNLVYKKDGNIITNPQSFLDNLNDLPTPDYTGLDLSLYMSPETIFTVQSSRGCYWKNCSFCDHHYGNKYAVKTPSKMVDELKEMKEKYNARFFYFVDEAISPNYVNNLSKKIIEKNLNISWCTCARAEEGFTEEVCDLAAKSGLKLVLWGLESGSERVLGLINKGISKAAYINTLKNTAKAGIWNHTFLFFGFPSEDLLEAMESINMLLENKTIINSYGMGPFSLGKYSPIAREPEKYFINYIAPSEEELATATEDFTTTRGMSRDDVNNFIVYNTEYCAEQYGYPLWMSIGGYKDHIFFYLDKYGPKVLSYTPDETVQMFGSF